jgi:hypothetical protein
MTQRFEADMTSRVEAPDWFQQTTRREQRNGCESGGYRPKAKNALIAATPKGRVAIGAKAMPALTSRITIRLSDAGMRRRQTKLIYPDHRPFPWLTEVWS